MKVVGTKILEELGEKHADVRSSVSAWLQEVREAQWTRPEDIKRRFPNASLLHDHIVIFDIKGNRYRLAVQVAYKTKVVVILRAGTHKDYDRWTF